MQVQVSINGKQTGVNDAAVVKAGDKLRFSVVCPAHSLAGDYPKIDRVLDLISVSFPDVEYFNSGKAHYVTVKATNDVLANEAILRIGEFISHGRTRPRGWFNPESGFIARKAIAVAAGCSDQNEEACAEWALANGYVLRDKLIRENWFPVTRGGYGLDRSSAAESIYRGFMMATGTDSRTGCYAGAPAWVKALVEPFLDALGWH